MQPNKEDLKRWLVAATAMQTLAIVLEKDYSPLLSGMILTAFQNPLLRTITIGGQQCIAHVTPHTSETTRSKDLANPLEACASEGDLRARTFGNLGKIAIERNKGSKQSSDVEKGVDDTRAGASSEWTVEQQYNLSTFKAIEIVLRGKELWHGVPTFDIIVTL